MDVSNVVVVSDVRDVSDVVVESDVLVVADVVDVSNAFGVFDVVVDLLSSLEVLVVLDSMVLDGLVTAGCSGSDALVWLLGSWDEVDESVTRVVCPAATPDDHGGVNGSRSGVEVGNGGMSHELEPGPSISVYVGWITSVK